MKIILGEQQDIDDILLMINSCVSDLRKNGIYQWDNNYPSKSIISEDIFKKELYTIKQNDRSIAIIVLNEFQDKEWETVQWSENKNPLIIHRLTVDVNLQKEGIGRKLINFALNYAKKNKYDSVRFDVYSGNPDLIKAYEKMGCEKKGEVFFPNRELPFYCYELLI